jgi:hypothetical protein
MIRAIIALIVLVVSSASGFAQAPPSTIPLKAGNATVLRLDRPFDSVIVGNSDLIDVQPIGNNRSLVVTAKKKAAGRTNLILLDNMGQTIYSADVVVTQPAPVFAKVVKFHTRGELNDYFPYSCSPEDCVRLKDEQPGEHSNDIFVPGLVQPGSININSSPSVNSPLAPPGGP